MPVKYVTFKDTLNEIEKELFERLKEELLHFEKGDPIFSDDPEIDIYLKPIAKYHIKIKWVYWDKITKRKRNDFAMLALLEVKGKEFVDSICFLETIPIVKKNLIFQMKQELKLS